MAEKQETEFINGLIVKKPSPKAPKWVLFNLSIKCEELINFIKTHADESGWINVDVKESKGGKIYCALNTYKRDGAKKKADTHDETGPEIEGEDEDIPF